MKERFEACINKLDELWEGALVDEYPYDDILNGLNNAKEVLQELYAENQALKADKGKSELNSRIRDQEEVIQGYESHIESIRQAFCILLNLIRLQGWAETTEYNYEFFEEDIFPILGVNSFADISKSAEAALQSKEE